MSTKGLTRKIRKAFSEFSAKDGYLYKVPIGSFLTGFALEPTPSAFYVWRYILPLYDESLEFFHLSFGQRLGTAFERSRAPGESEQIYRYVVDLISSHDLIGGSGDVRDLIPYLRSLEMDHRRVQKLVGYSLIMAEDYDAASSVLEALAADGGSRMGGDGVSQVLEQLLRNGRDAKQLLCSWVDESKRKLELDS